MLLNINVENTLKTVLHNYASTIKTTTCAIDSEALTSSGTNTSVD